MHRMLTITTKHRDVPVAEFRNFMRDDYGLVYRDMPQVRAYSQYFLSPIEAATDGGPDAVVMIAFDSHEAMREALETDAYRAAVQQRQKYMAVVQPNILDSVVNFA